MYLAFLHCVSQLINNIIIRSKRLVTSNEYSLLCVIKTMNAVTYKS